MIADNISPGGLQWIGKGVMARHHNLLKNDLSVIMNYGRALADGFWRMGCTGVVALGSLGEGANAFFLGERPPIFVIV